MFNTGGRGQSSEKHLDFDAKVLSYLKRECWASFANRAMCDKTLCIVDGSSRPDDLYGGKIAIGEKLLGLPAMHTDHLSSPYKPCFELCNFGEMIMLSKILYHEERCTILNNLEVY